MKPQPRPGCSVTDDGVSIRNASVMNEIISRMCQVGEGFRAPALRAARDGLINLALVPPGERVSARILKFRAPTMLILLDDAPDAAGPDRWPQAAKLLRWAGHATFHAAAGQEAHYGAAVLMAGATGRALLVEMPSADHPAWLRLAARTAPRLPLLNIVPTHGVHPIEGAPKGVRVQ